MQRGHLPHVGKGEVFCPRSGDTAGASRVRAAITCSPDNYGIHALIGAIDPARFVWMVGKQRAPHRKAWGSFTYSRHSVNTHA